MTAHDIAADTEELLLIATCEGDAMYVRGRPVAHAPGLALARHPRDPARWTVIHRASGRQVLDTHDDLDEDQARHLARVLADTGLDWSLPGEQLTADVAAWEAVRQAWHAFQREWGWSL